MATIATKILIVGEAGLGISFNPTQDPTNCTFTISQFLYLIRNNPQAVFSVDTASRRTDPSATFQNFTFSNASLVKYNVLWLFGYEGLDDNQLQPTPGTGPISDAERLAILAFMDRGGGVFATGDHSGLGSFMCGNIPRVRTMRKWYGRQVDLPPDRQTGLDLHGNTVSMVNWSGLSGSSNSGLPRLDTLRQNVSDAAGVYDFDNQSDNIPQTLFVVQPAHPILQAGDGPIQRFPDHMHEGEVVTPVNNLQMTIGSSTFAEFPPDYSANNSYPMPAIIATGVTIPEHSTNVFEVKGCAFTGDGQPSVGMAAGTLCAYDGLGAQVGRIVTDSSFHHYLDLNLIGNPDAVTADRRSGFGPAYTPPAANSVMADLQQFYVNTIRWLALPPRGLAASQQFGVATQTDLFAVDDTGNIVVWWGDGVGGWNGPSYLTSDSTFVPGGCVQAAQRAATPNQTDVFAVDVTGVIQVFSVIASANWAQTATIGNPGQFVPGAPIAVSQQFGVPEQTDVFCVDASGTLFVSWAGPGGWQPPRQIWSPEFSYPGACVVASNHFGIPNQTDVFVVGGGGTVWVASVQSSQPWGSAITVSKAFILPPHGGIAVSNQFGIPSQTDVFAVDSTGTLTVYWAFGNATSWGGPAAIGPAGTFPPGAQLAASNQFGLPDQTDVFAIDNSGALTVSWVVGGGVWAGPVRISPSGLFEPGAAVAACGQAGVPNQTNVFALNRWGVILFFKVLGGGTWEGPFTV